ncbi:hypothetical protein [Aurantiacibacter zhengii]|uniref:Uncharacterized protein n=1 Tax=Aurantiacibacter zhengii TaxID=2307003 RepID=A0A418NTR1_9SPHN|nr:hypothetical protein [Aurantiacibacter zhengii]RIV86803.1 hypothetical protein D2V07_08945 [Aurantiacibacter zhengii]
MSTGRSRTDKPVTRRQRQSLWYVFAIPASLLAASIAGLVLGLTGDGLRDAFAWGLLSLPIILAANAFVRRS